MLCAAFGLRSAQSIQFNGLEVAALQPMNRTIKKHFKFLAMRDLMYRTILVAVCSAIYMNSKILSFFVCIRESCCIRPFFFAYAALIEH